jgi:hypothetical protein
VEHHLEQCPACERTTSATQRRNRKTRYVEEKKALDAEFAVIETLERAASEFMLKLNPENGAIPLEPTAPTDGDEQDDNVATVAEASQLAAPIDMLAGGESGSNLEGVAQQPAAESDQASGSEIGGGLDILKPGSRWRLYRGTRATDPEGIASDASPSTG